jgi:tRNA (guanine-N7-)-methyltransferase
VGQKKLIRFEELKGFRNVLQYPEARPVDWKQVFKNEHPLVLELACGKGEYTTGLGALYPERNFIGVDIKGNRLWVGAKKALGQRLDNVAFLRTQIEMIPLYFEFQSVDEIWITFPDPQLRFSKAKKRLTHPKFLRLYHQVLKPGGIIHLKTDSPNLYRFTKTVMDMYGCQLLGDFDNLYLEKNLPPEYYIRTHYEQLDIAQSERIHYLSFTLPARLPGPEMDADLKEAIRYELD